MNSSRSLICRRKWKQNLTFLLVNLIQASAIWFATLEALKWPSQMCSRGLSQEHFVVIVSPLAVFSVSKITSSLTVRSSSEKRKEEAISSIEGWCSVIGQLSSFWSFPFYFRIYWTLLDVDGRHKFYEHFRHVKTRCSFGKIASLPSLMASLCSVLPRFHVQWSSRQSGFFVAP